jgi:hypothetical protein
MHFMPLSFSISVCVAKAFLGFRHDIAAGYIQQPSLSLKCHYPAAEKMKKPLPCAARNTHTHKNILFSHYVAAFILSAHAGKKETALSLPFFSFCGMKRTCTSDSARRALFYRRAKTKSLWRAAF